MSARIFIEFIKQVEKIDKIRGLPSILFLFRNEFDKFNNTVARILDSIYINYDIKIILKSFFSVNVRVLPYD